MPNLTNQLELERCTHCDIDKPNLIFQWEIRTDSSVNDNQRYWAIYKCNRCGGLITAAAQTQTGEVLEVYPSEGRINDSIPQSARNYLGQALNSLRAPAGAVMLVASAVDAMLKEKGYKDGSLSDRLNRASEDRLILKAMAKWAYKIKLRDNNHQENSGAKLPTEEDAQKCIDFALILADYLFVLPSRIKQGLEDAEQSR